jgi:hypothetical protein
MSEVGQQVRNVGIVIHLAAVTGCAGVVAHDLLRARGSFVIALLGIVTHHDSFL